MKEQEILQRNRIDGLEVGAVRETFFFSTIDGQLCQWDEYRTTAAELAEEGNGYNFPAVYQLERFFRWASTEEKQALKQAIREKRFHLSPVPAQTRPTVR